MTKQKRSPGGEKKYPWTAKRVIAWIAIVLLTGLYLLTLIASLLARPGAARLFRLCLGLTILVPIAAWVAIYAVGFFTKKHTIASLDILSSNEEARREMEEALRRSAENEGKDEA